MRGEAARKGDSEMQSRTFGLGLAIAGVALAVVLFVVLSGDDDSGSTPTTTTAADSSSDGGGGASSVPTIVVKDGQPVGGVQDLSFDKGDQIQFVVESDTADEVHFHGYDIGKDVQGGGRVEFDVPATIDGVYEVELETSHTQLAQITVNP
jgi:hypothetical protein